MVALISLLIRATHAFQSVTNHALGKTLVADSGMTITNPTFATDESYSSAVTLTRDGFGTSSVFDLWLGAAVPIGSIVTVIEFAANGDFSAHRMSIWAGYS